MVDVIRAHQDELLACYDAGKVKKPYGIVGLRFDVAADGRVRGVTIESDDFAGSSIASCVAGAALKWEFPPGTRADVRAGLHIGRTPARR